MKTIDPSQVLHEISNEQLPQELDLLTGILASLDKESPRSMKPGKRFVLAFVLTLVVFVFLVFNIPGVASAMRRMLGFIPGIGLVDQSTPLRVLAEPVSELRDVFTINIENAVLDSEHTVLTYSVEGPFDAGILPADGALSDICFKAAELRLSDGTRYQLPDGFPDETWSTGYRVQSTYPAIPVEIYQAALFLPCLHARTKGQSPENWSVPLTFVPAPPELTVYPISRQVAPTVEKTAEITETRSLPGIEFSLESVIPVADGQLVQIRTDWRKDPGIIWVMLNPEDIQILDSNGQAVSFEPSWDAIDLTIIDFQSAVVGFKTSAMASNGPAKLVINAASEVTYTSSASFVFDPASPPSADQTWELNKDLELDGRTLRILDVSVAEGGGNASLSVSMESADGIINAGVMDAQHPALSGGYGSDSNGNDPVQRFWTTFNYEGGLPQGPITLTVSSYSIRLPGPWVVDWTPMVAAEAAPASTTDSQTACITEQDWKIARETTKTIPEELSGQILVQAFELGTSPNPLYITRLDGREKQPLLEDGTNAVLSPDGTRLVYTNAEGGLFIYTLATGESEPVVGASSNPGVVRPFWSPDGKQLAFTGTPDSTSPNLYLSNLDGKPAKLIGNAEPIKLIQGWLPDGRILYVTLDENDPALKNYNPQSGETSTLFNVPQLTTSVAVSENGKRLALNWLEESGKQRVYVFTLDGSQRKPLLEVSSEGYIRSMLWTPDGSHLLLDLSWAIPGDPYSKALVQVDTCQIFPITHLQGSVLDWTP